MSNTKLYEAVNFEITGSIMPQLVGPDTLVSRQQLVEKVGHILRTYVHLYGIHCMAGFGCKIDYTNQQNAITFHIDAVSKLIEFKFNTPGDDDKVLPSELVAPLW